MAMQHKREPTVYPADNFNVSEDGEALRAAMKGMGTDEDTIIEILTARSNKQRQQIAKYFAQQLERDLIEDLKSELGGHFESVIVGLVLSPEEYLCKQLHKAMDGIGTNEHTLVEIICSKTNEELNSIIETYERMYDRPLVEHMCSETSGDLRRILTLILTRQRENGHHVDEEKAREQAEELFNAGEGAFGTEESVFTRILGHENFSQLYQIFEEYKNVSGNTIEQALKHEMGGEILEGLLAIVECVQNPACFFAKRLHHAMSGMGTDDDTLIRIIVSRSEIDLGTIKEEFERIYDKTLQSFVSQGETSGDYKKALIALLR